MKFYISVTKRFREFREARYLLRHIKSLGDLSNLDSTEAYYLSYDAKDMAARTTALAKFAFLIYCVMNVPIIAVGTFKDFLPYPKLSFALVAILYLSSLAVAFWIKFAIVERLGDYMLDLKSASIPPSKVNDQPAL